MSKLWVFGDSFSTPFDRYPQYCEFKGYTPKSYYEIVAEKYNMDIECHALGGADNRSIVDSLVPHLENIKSNDIIIIGWTDWYRTRIVGDDGRWECLNPGHVNQPTVNFKNFSIKSIKELIFNRENVKYIHEMNDLIKLIKFTFRDNIVVDWCWIDEDNQLNCSIPHVGRQKTIKEETNDLIWDYHWGEEGHLNLSKEIISYLIPMIKPTRLI
jgi:hypothetical protein